METSEFKVGDKVICIRPQSNYEWMLNKSFIIKEITGYYVPGDQRLIFNETNTVGHSSTRFKLAPIDKITTQNLSRINQIEF